MNRLSIAQESHFENFYTITNELNKSLKELDKTFEEKKLSDEKFQKIDMIINNLVTYNNYLEILKVKYNHVVTLLNDIKIDDE